MDNLSHTQKRIIDQLYGPIEDMESIGYLQRVCKFYRRVIENIDDQYIHQVFCDIINSKLFWVLKSKDEFYDLDQFKQNYEELSKGFILDYIDGTETDFIYHYINSQKEIIDKTFTYLVKLDGYKSLEVVQFVSKGFFDEFIPSSRAKINFLEEKLKKILGVDPKSLGGDNPYPLLFINEEVYHNFMKYASKYIIDYYLDYSYLKKRLDNENLIHGTMDNDFMKIIYDEMELISERDYRDYQIKNRLYSLNKSSSVARENNFNNIFLD